MIRTRYLLPIYLSNPLTFQAASLWKTRRFRPAGRFLSFPLLLMRTWYLNFVPWPASQIFLCSLTLRTLPELAAEEKERCAQEERALVSVILLPFSSEFPVLRSCPFSFSLVGTSDRLFCFEKLGNERGLTVHVQLASPALDATSR